MNDAMTQDNLVGNNEPTDSDSDRFSFQSSEQKKSPQLSHRGLSLMLAIMCLIPVITIGVLWSYLPPVYEGTLEANVFAENLPGREFYAIEYYERAPVEEGELVLQNMSDQDWTHLNIQINGNYQIYDTDPIPAHDEGRFKLSRFVNRTGARFSLQFNELSRVRIYARRPTKDRATYYHEFPTHFPVPSRFLPSAIMLGVFAVLLAIAAWIFVRLRSTTADA